MRNRIVGIWPPTHDCDGTSCPQDQLSLDGFERVRWDNNAVNDSAGTWATQTVYDSSGRLLQVTNLYHFATEIPATLSGAIRPAPGRTASC